MKRVMWCVVATLCSAAVAHADLMVKYDNSANGTIVDGPDTDPNYYTMAPSASSSSVSADRISAGSGVGDLGLTLNGTTLWGSTSWGSANTTEAVTNNDVWKWGFTVLPGQAVTLDTLELNVRWFTNSTTPFGFNYAITATVDSVATYSIFSDSLPATHPVNVDKTGASAIDLSSILPTLTENQSIEFTLAGAEVSPEIANSGLLFFTNATGLIQLNGSVTAVPEPSAYLMLGLVGAGVWMRRKLAQGA